MPNLRRWLEPAQPPEIAEAWLVFSQQLTLPSVLFAPAHFICENLKQLKLRQGASLAEPGCLSISQDLQSALGELTIKLTYKHIETKPR